MAQPPQILRQRIVKGARRQENDPVLSLSEVIVAANSTLRPFLSRLSNVYGSVGGAGIVSLLSLGSVAEAILTPIGESVRGN